MNTAVYTKTVPDKKATWKPSSITVGHRRADGTWHRETGFVFQHNHTHDESHRLAVLKYVVSHPAINNSFNMAPAHDGKHAYIFI